MVDILQENSAARLLEQTEPEAIEQELFRPPRVTNRFEDLNNLNSASDQFGRPLDRVDIRNTTLETDATGRPIH